MRKNYDLMWVREHVGLNQKEAAALVGVSRETFSRWEAGSAKTPPRKYAAFLKAAAVEQKDIPKHGPPTSGEEALTESPPGGYDAYGFPPGWKDPKGKDIASLDALQEYALKLFEGKHYKEREAFRAQFYVYPANPELKEAALRALRKVCPKGVPFVDLLSALSGTPNERAEANTAVQELIAEKRARCQDNVIYLDEATAKAIAVAKAQDPDGSKRAAAEKAWAEKAEAERKDYIEREAAAEREAFAEQVRQKIRDKHIEARAAKVLAAEEEEARFRAERRAEREAARLLEESKDL